MSEREAQERLEDFSRLVGPTAGMLAHHSGELLALKEAIKAQAQTTNLTLERFERDSKQRFDEAFEKFDEVIALQKQTNGRVTALEMTKVAEEAVRLARAADVEAQKTTTALRLARHGWIRPMVAGGGMSVLVAAATKLVV